MRAVGEADPVPANRSADGVPPLGAVNEVDALALLADHDVGDGLGEKIWGADLHCLPGHVDDTTDVEGDSIQLNGAIREIPPSVLRRLTVVGGGEDALLQAAVVVQCQVNRIGWQRLGPWRDEMGPPTVPELWQVGTVHPLLGRQFQPVAVHSGPQVQKQAPRDLRAPSRSR